MPESMIMQCRRNFLVGGSAFLTGVAMGRPVDYAAAQRVGATTAGNAKAAVFAKPEPWAAKLIMHAEKQVGVTVGYNGAYVRLAYPNGDVARQTGVCTDVIIRAYRDAFGVDLQVLVHEDMKRAFSAYPRNWGLKRPDRNIDHRRVLNLQRFFARRGNALLIGQNAAAYRPGDLVAQRLPGNLPHIGIVTHHPNADGTRPLMVHNIGAGARLDDTLFTYTITGHYRFKPI
jgi:uncharacterized protein YijF (DUF1287 family)